MGELGERVAVVETTVKALSRTVDGIDEKLDSLLESQSQTTAYERLGKQIYDLVKIVLAALAGVWAASLPWFHK